MARMASKEGFARALERMEPHDGHVTTSNALVIRNPGRKYAVVKGPLSANDKCRKLYGSKLVRVRAQVK